MRTTLALIAVVTLELPRLGAAPPEPVRLTQDKPRPHPKVKLPEGHAAGPTLPGLTGGQGAIPQGLAYWEKEDWFLASFHFEAVGRPAVIAALEAKTGRMVRCLTLLGAGGSAHAGHVGGMAVSGKHLWVGSGKVYRVPLADLVAAKAVDHLRLETPFEAACTASYVACHDGRLWVGEFVLTKEDRYKGDPTHRIKDRNGVEKHAWAVGYALDANGDLAAPAGKQPLPDCILSVRQKVQGMAFHDRSIVLSTSYGRDADSTLAAYANPLPTERKSPRATVKVGGKPVPIWFLDGKNRQWEMEDFPPMSEGIVSCGKRLAVICESGAEKFQKGGRGPLDTVILFTPPTGK